jgi:hypothetical protein
MVEVFKTDVTNEAEARKVVRFLLDAYPSYEINFDLEDCDHILRVKGCDQVELTSLLETLLKFGIKAESLS